MVPLRIENELWNPAPPLLDIFACQSLYLVKYDIQDIAWGEGYAWYIFWPVELTWDKHG